MSYHNQDQLISSILNTRPNQLPPVVHAEGCYTLDIEYLGRKHHKIGVSLVEVLQGYWEFVSKTNYIHYRHSGSPLADLPIKAGTKLYPVRDEG